MQIQGSMYIVIMHHTKYIRFAMFSIVSSNCSVTFNVEDLRYTQTIQVIIFNTWQLSPCDDHFEAKFIFFAQKKYFSHTSIGIRCEFIWQSNESVILVEFVTLELPRGSTSRFYCPPQYLEPPLGLDQKPLVYTSP